MVHLEISRDPPSPALVAEALMRAVLQAPSTELAAVTMIKAKEVQVLLMTQMLPV